MSSVLKTQSSHTSPPGESTIPINPDLVWDYDVPPENEQSEAFRRWYIARVLTRGRVEDIKAVGLERIFHYLPSLNLPPKIRRFWEWYFSLPEARQRYGDTYPATTPDAVIDRSNPVKV
jgi:hypothetical protein